jgi:glutathione S-transferase
MLTVHHLGVSQSERIVWLCEELEIPYELARYERDPVTRLAPPAYKALHPMGTAPVITDGDLVLSESGAIMEYIIARHGGGRLSVPSEDPEFPDYLFWLHFANASVMPAGMVAMILGILQVDEAHPLRGALGARGVAAFAMIEKRLGESPWFAGPDFTAADIIMVFPLTTMRAFAPMDLTPFPNIRAYLKRIGERRGYQRAMAKGDPDMTPMLE